MAAITKWRVRFQAIIEIEVDAEYAYDAREKAASAVSRYFEGAAVESLSFLSSEQFERAELPHRVRTEIGAEGMDRAAERVRPPPVGPKDRERIAREAADALPSDDDPCWSEDGTEEEQEAEEEERGAQGPLAGPAEEPEGAKVAGGEGAQDAATVGVQDGERGFPVDSSEPSPVRDDGYP